MYVLDFHFLKWQIKKNGSEMKLLNRAQVPRKPVLKSPKIAPNSLFTLPKVRVRCDQKRLKNRLQFDPQVSVSVFVSLLLSLFFAGVG